ncbi:MAG: mandelate racemase [Ectothiorhodospiraceae bacterium]|nr:mandelate racemase [Ectothiorhodospiraceae bacterium]
MKIDDLTVTLFAWDDIPATRYAAHTGRFSGRSHLGLVTVRTDVGVEGHAFLGSASWSAELDARGVVEKLKPQVMGEDPLDRERLWGRLADRVRHTNWRSIGAVDVALWDIAGKVAGLPLHRLMGTYRHAIPAYASSAVLDSPEAYAEEAVAFRDAGWKAYKIHPPQDPDRDIAVCEAVRRAVGDDFRLMLDATWAYRYEQALRVGRAIEALGFYWYEDPLADDDINGYVRLREKLDIPLLATEYSPGSFHAYQPWLLMRATDMLRGDVAVKGGITPILKTAHLAEAFRMNYEIHHGGNSLNNVANLHVTMSIPNTEMFEVLLPAGAQKYGLVDDIEIGPDGLVHAPTAPGLGHTVDHELVARKRTTTLR